MEGGGALFSSTAQRGLAMPMQKGKLEDQFEARWRTAYEVRHLENQNRHKAAEEAKSSTAPPTVSVHAITGGVGHPAKPAAQAAAHSLPSTAVASSKAGIREQEVEDEEDEDEGSPGRPCQGPTEPLGTAGEPAGGDEEDAEPDCRVIWDSSYSSQQPAPGAPAAPAPDTAAAAHKQRGTACLKQGDLPGTLECYSAAVEAGLAEGADDKALAALYSNRSHVLHKLGRNQEAVADAKEAHCRFPTWPKPLYRLAQAQLALGQFVPAVAACLQGEGLSKRDSEGHTEFTPLLDRLAVAAAKAGSPAGFTGMLLEVRDAGEEAWLCRPAPYVPELDGPEDEDNQLPNTHLPLPGTAGEGAAGALSTLSLSSSGGAGVGDALATWDYRQTAAARQRRRTSFRSIKEAVTAAQDGDRILLRRGTHNGMGEAINVNKRVLIMGEGALGETVIDQRANSPTFRITRGGVVIRNLDIDMSGFCEALMVAGGPAVAPLIEECLIKCSGDDGINVAGQADPTFRHCRVTVKKCGAKLYEASRGRFEDCHFEKCGEQGLKAMESAAPVLARCTFSECTEEGIVAMDSARVTLLECSISGCKGPGLDCSDRAQASIRGGSIEGNVGGVWVWDGSRAALEGVVVGGGPSHAILADGSAVLDVKESRINGSVHATDLGWEGLLQPGSNNALRDPEQPTDFPAEEGPFKFVPNHITRKQ